MPQSIFEVVIRSLKQGQGGKQAAAEIKELKSVVGEISQGFLGFNAASLTAAGAVTALGGVVMKAGQFAAQAVRDYQDYGEEIRTLSAITGTGAEQTSRLVQAFDDLGVTQEQFKTLAEGAAKKGFVMTIDNVANLADKMNGLNTQEEKNKLLTDTLGKTALEAAKAFQQGGQAIREAAESQAAGMIITEKQALDLELLRRQQDQLNDVQTATKNQLAQGLVPMQLDFTSAILKTLDGEYSLMNFINGTGIVGLANHEKQLRLNTEAALLAGKAAGTYANDVGTNFANAASAVEESQKRQQDALDTSMKKYTTQLMYQMMTEGMDVESKMKFAEALGLVDNHTVAAMKATEELRKKMEEGKITIGGAAAEAAAFSNILLGIPTVKNVVLDITIREHYASGAAAHVTEQYSGGYVDPGTGSKHANGTNGWVTVPSNYPNDSYMVALSGGEQFAVRNDRQKWTGTGADNGGGGGPLVSIGEVHIHNEMDYQTFKNRLLADIGRAR